MCEHFVLDDGGVLVDVDVFDGERRDLGEEDAAEGVGDAGVDADEGEGEVEGFRGVELDFEVLGRELVWGQLRVGGGNGLGIPL